MRIRFYGYRSSTAPTSRLFKFHTDKKAFTLAANNALSDCTGQGRDIKNIQNISHEGDKGGYVDSWFQTGSKFLNGSIEWIQKKIMTSQLITRSDWSIVHGSSKQTASAAAGSARDFHTFSTSIPFLYFLCVLCEVIKAAAVVNFVRCAFTCSAVYSQIRFLAEEVARVRVAHQSQQPSPPLSNSHS